eukprot:scaffold508602_cov15-Prasinocladus_malaysianus.AAC.1
MGLEGYCSWALLAWLGHCQTMLCRQLTDCCLQTLPVLPPAEPGKAPAGRCSSVLRASYQRK